MGTMYRECRLHGICGQEIRYNLQFIKLIEGYRKAFLTYQLGKLRHYVVRPNLASHINYAGDDGLLDASNIFDTALVRQNADRDKSLH